jgi:hypothetical protein
MCARENKPLIQKGWEACLQACAHTCMHTEEASSYSSAGVMCHKIHATPHANVSQKRYVVRHSAESYVSMLKPQDFTDTLRATS